MWVDFHKHRSKNQQYCSFLIWGTQNQFYQVAKFHEQSEKKKKEHQNPISGSVHKRNKIILKSQNKKHNIKNFLNNNLATKSEKDE